MTGPLSGKVVLLAMHGSPPRDFPQAELREFFRLHAQAGLPQMDEAAHARLEALDAKMRTWARDDRPVLGRVL